MNKKHELKVEAIELNEGGNMVAMKGKRVKVIEINELDKEFMNHRFKSQTLKVMFWSQFNIDYFGG